MNYYQLELVFSFATILTSHIIFSLFPKLSAYPSPNYFSNSCREQCKLNRLNGSTEAYIINCNDFSQLEHYECEFACRECTSHEICALNANPLQIKCPSTILVNGPCKSRCDYHRPDDFLGEFSFNCRNHVLFPSLWERRQCSNDCLSCPIDICDAITKEFECPLVETMPLRPPSPPSGPTYEGQCESRCDKNRPSSSRKQKNRYTIHTIHYDTYEEEEVEDDEDRYSFACSDLYSGRQEQFEMCFEDCTKCPLEVCDPLYTLNGIGPVAVFNCPNSKATPSPEPPKPGVFTASWTIIGLIAVAVIGCIVTTAFYGRSSSCGCFRTRELQEIQIQQAQNATTI